MPNQYVRQIFIAIKYQLSQKNDLQYLHIQVVVIIHRFQRGGPFHVHQSRWVFRVKFLTYGSIFDLHSGISEFYHDLKNLKRPCNFRSKIFIHMAMKLLGIYTKGFGILVIQMGRFVKVQIQVESLSQ